MDNILNLLPSFFALILYTIDATTGLTEKKFFGKARKNAIQNVFKKIDSDPSIILDDNSKARLKKTIEAWHFNCFRVTIFGIAQLQFLELMLVQCLIFSITWLSVDSNALLISIILAVAYFALYLATLLQHENFTWFNPKSTKTGRENKKTPNIHIERRLITIIFTASLLFFGENIMLMYQNMKAYAVGTGLITPNSIFAIIIIAIIVIIFVLIFFRTKKNHYQK